MAKIPLRVYNREIESLIDQGQALEAIAHCQYILKTFPKCVDTYRLLGKSFLETQRYGEAADVFQRVLLAVPDDFIANLGMSIVYDEQKNVDSAIWYMERAYEAQPSNTAIQGELKRLYGRRDGMEPPKIRLTRGALAQMYARGEQYTQAIAEIKSVLADEPQRMDLQVLLARVYSKSGHKVEATDMCANLIKRYPYCLDANRVMVEILNLAGHVESTQTYRQRVNALDPYAAFVTGSVFNSAEVVDAAVVIEKLDYEPPAYDPAAPQLSDGMSQETSDWLNQPADNSFEAEPSIDEAPLPPSGGEDIPDWLKAAGWDTSSAAAVKAAELAGSRELAEQDKVADDLAQGEMPDWLKSIAPPGALEQAVPDDVVDDILADEDEKWLEGLGAPGLGGESEKPAEQELDLFAETPEITVDNGLVGFAAASQIFSNEETDQPQDSTIPPDSFDEPEGISEKPDWQAPSDKTDEPLSFDNGEIPDWLKSLSAEDAGKIEITADEEFDAPLAGLAAAEVPAWIKEVGVQATDLPVEEHAEELQEQANSDTPDWLNEVSGPKSEGDQQLPDWLSDTDESTASTFEEEAISEQPVLSAETTANAEQTEEDDAFAWLESLAAKQGANPEELLTKPEDRPTETPDWLGNFGDNAGKEIFIAGAAGAAASLISGEEEQPVEHVLEEDFVIEDGEPQTEFATQEPVDEYPVDPLVEVPTQKTVPDSGMPMSEDDAFAWLESLAANQGAKPEELLTKPEDRPVETPDWVAELGEEEKAPLFDAGATAAVFIGENEEQLQPLEPVVAQPDYIEPEAMTEDVQTESDEQPTPEAGLPASEDDTFAWLESLAATQGAKPEELLTSPENRPVEIPDWVADLGEEENAPQLNSDVNAEVSIGENEEKPSQEPVAFQPEYLEPDTEPEEVPSTSVSEAAIDAGMPVSEDDAFAWLESLAARQGAKPEELLTKPEDRPDEAPAWVEQLGEEETSAASLPSEIEKSTEIPDEFRAYKEEVSLETGAEPIREEEPVSQGSLATDAPMSEDDAFAWLEALAAKQGANPDELLTKPEDRPVETPDWVEALGEETSLEEIDSIAAAAAATVASQMAGRETPPEEKPISEPQADDSSWMLELKEPLIEEPVLPPVEFSAQDESLESEPEKESAFASENIYQPVEETESSIKGVTDWLQQLEDDEQIEEVKSLGMPEPDSEELPDWIEKVEAVEQQSTEKDLPDWLREDVVGEEEPEPSVASPLEWRPVEPPVETQMETSSDRALPMRTSKIPASGGSSEKDLASFEQAQIDLQRSNLEPAMQGYSKLIRRGKMLDETIFDLREALYRYPVDVIIWQTLGDAYMRANRLQDALDAYTKAEELLR